MTRNFDDYPVDQLEIVLMVDRKWTCSSMPHPLVSCDFDQNDDLYSISALSKGGCIGTLRAVADWYEADEAPDQEKLLTRLSKIPA